MQVFICMSLCCLVCVIDAVSYSAAVLSNNGSPVYNQVENMSFTNDLKRTDCVKFVTNDHKAESRSMKRNSVQAPLNNRTETFRMTFTIFFVPVMNYFFILSH